MAIIESLEFADLGSLFSCSFTALLKQAPCPSCEPLSTPARTCRWPPDHPPPMAHPGTTMGENTIATWPG